MNTSATNKRLHQLLVRIGDGTLIPRPEFQRRQVWTSEDKERFIETILEGYPFPEIYIAAGTLDPKSGQSTEMLVDGQQRITTLYQYFSGDADLKLSAIPHYDQLPLDRQIAFLEYLVVVRDLGQMPINDIVEIFTRINSTNYSLNAMEINNARYNGALKQFAEEVAKHDLFESKRVFSVTDIRRMGDLRFTLTIIITIFSTYFNRDDELDTYLAEYNDSFEEKDKIRTELEETFGFIHRFNFRSAHRIWRKNDLLNLIVEVHRALFKLRKNLEPEQVRDRLMDFYTQLEESKDNPDPTTIVGRFARLSQQSTNDRNSRIQRGEILLQVIMGSEQS